MHWDPQSLLPMVDHSFFTVNLKLFRLDNDRKDWIPFLDVKEGHPNSGVVEFSMPSSDSAISSVYPVALRVSVGEQVAMGAQEDISQLSDVILSAQDTVSQWFSSFFYYVINSSDLLDECLQWHESEPLNISEMLLSRVPGCCQTAERAAAAGFVRDTHDTFVDFFHPGAASCYRQATITRLDHMNMNILPAQLVYMMNTGEHNIIYISFRVKAAVL